MKSKIGLFLGLMVLLFSCNKTNDTDDYESKINNKINEIQQIIGNAESSDSKNCRIHYITSGNGCGPYFVFNIKTVDSILLYTKFRELSKIKQDYFNSGTFPVCDMLFADSLIIVNGKCKECYIDSIKSHYDQFVNSKISELQNKPKRNPPAELWRWDFKNSHYYYIPPYCCDVYSELYNSNGELICHPDGGITGGGDGKCPNLPRDSINYTLIWKDNR